VVFDSGARLDADAQRLDAIHEWTRSVIESISCRVGDDRVPTPSVVGWDPPPPFVPTGELRFGYCLYPGSVTPDFAPAGYGNTHLRSVQDPAIHVHTVPDRVDAYPWASLAIEGDTAQVRVTRTHPDLHTAYAVYAFLHLVHRQGRIEAWLPEAAEADGLALERAIVRRTADAWLLGRSAYQLDPHDALDALLYASESGYLDAFLLTIRPEDFPEELERWLEENPQGPERYRQWFRSELGYDPPGPGVDSGHRP
jgi:hypothetical protein